MRESNGISAETRSTTSFATQIHVLKSICDSGLTLGGLGRLLVQWTLDLLPEAACILTLKKPTGETVRLEGVVVNGAASIEETQETAEEPLAGASSDLGFESDDPAVLRLAEYSDLVQHEQPKSGERGHWIALPILHGSDNFGHLAAFADRPFSAGVWESLSELATQFGFLLSQRFALEQVSDLAYIDEVTGIHNRRYFRKALDHWLTRAKRERFPVSLFLLDIDHFKLFNDTWGHATGDRVLQMIGSLLKTVFRNMDVVSRFGGEEFAVLLCDHRKEDTAEHPREVLQFAERFRRAAESISMTSEDGRRLSQITVSGGIATYPWDATSADLLLQRADEALYRAKRSGRNQILLAERPEPTKQAG